MKILPALLASAFAGAPCTCVNSDPKWTQPAQRPPQCVFMDLGAGDGETLRVFAGNSQKWQFNYLAPTPQFTPAQCGALLIEANPRFEPQLKAAATEVHALDQRVPAKPAFLQLKRAKTPVEWPEPGKTLPLPAVAAYVCDAKTQFFLDTNTNSGWGSSLDDSHPDVKAKKQAVDVTLANVNRLIIENVRPEDTLIVKMDIEGAEWDILPCLAHGPAAKLIDVLYLEDHCPSGDKNVGWCPSKGQLGYTRQQFDGALNALKGAGVQMPQYWSPLL